MEVASYEGYDRSIRMISRRLAGLISLCAAFAASSAGAERFDHAVLLGQQKSGNYYVTVELEAGVGREFLVDTGSGFVALTRETFESVRKLPGTTHLRDITGALANGKTLRVPVYQIAMLRLGTNCVLEDVEVAVMPGSTRDILGMSALRRLAPFAMDLVSPPTLLFSNCADAAI